MTYCLIELYRLRLADPLEQLALGSSCISSAFALDRTQSASGPLLIHAPAAYSLQATHPVTVPKETRLMEP